MDLGAGKIPQLLQLIRLAVSPLLIALAMALTAHLLAMAWVDWVACFEGEARQSSAAYREYITYLLFNPGMAALTLGAPFLAFALVAVVVRATVRLLWQWIGIGITSAINTLLVVGISSQQACPDEGLPSEYGIPELIPMVMGGGMGFAVCLIVTYIGSVRHARRNAS